MIYKNMTNATKTFYGVEFKPGEEHEVAGYINHPKFIRLKEFTSKPITTKKTESVRKPNPLTKTSIIKEESADGSDKNQ